jgi:3-hydroxybutyrate dehydrogenase
MHGGIHANHILQIRRSHGPTKLFHHSINSQIVCAVVNGFEEALKAPYVTAKHGLLGLTRVIAKEGATHGIRANLVCPGFVRTPLVESQIAPQAAALGISEDDVIRKVMLKDTVDGEFTTLADVANVTAYLAGFPTNALTGQSVIVSHGWHMH